MNCTLYHCAATSGARSRMAFNESGEDLFWHFLVSFPILWLYFLWRSIDNSFCSEVIYRTEGKLLPCTLPYIYMHSRTKNTGYTGYIVLCWAATRMNHYLTSNLHQTPLHLSTILELDGKADWVVKGSYRCRRQRGTGCTGRGGWSTACPTGTRGRSCWWC